MAEKDVIKENTKVEYISIAIAIVIIITLIPYLKNTNVYYLLFLQLIVITVLILRVTRPSKIIVDSKGIKIYDVNKNIYISANDIKSIKKYQHVKRKIVILLGYV